MNNEQKQQLLDYYKNLLILQYNQQNGTARATIDALVSEVLDALIIQQIEESFNIDTAIGAQLDIIAKYMGLQRRVLNYGNLTDDELRILIKFAILKNNNLSSTQAISESLYALFGNKISIVDNKNMTIRYNINSEISQVVVDILTQNNLLPKPMGVGIEVLYIDEVLGFEGSELQTFDNGVFYDPEQQIEVESILTINCNEPDVTIIINNEQTRTKKMETGSGYTWSVSKPGYQTATGSGTLTEDVLIDISILKIEATPSIATVIVNGIEQKGILFETGTTLNYTYSVSASGYETKTGTGTITSSYTIPVALGYTITINAPLGAIVNINGEETNYTSLPASTSYSWSVSASGYLTASSSGVLNESKVFNVYSVMGNGALFNFNNSGNSLAYALEGTTLSYIASSTGYISYSGTKLITSNTVINMATLTADITPVPDIISINGSLGHIALFEDGQDFFYNILAKKEGYQDYSSSGTVNETTTVTGQMSVTYPSFSATYSNNYVQGQVNELVYETTITSATAGNYLFTIKGGGDGYSGSTSQLYGSAKYYGYGRGGIASGKITLRNGAKISFYRIGALVPQKQNTTEVGGTIRPGGQGIAIYIDNQIKLVAAGGGQGSITFTPNQSGTAYGANLYNAGGGGYNGGNGDNSGNGLSYDGTAGNNSTQTSGTPFGGNGGVSNTSTSFGSLGKGGSGYVASNFTPGSGSLFSHYTVVSLNCTGGSNWGATNAGNSGAASITFEHE